MSMHLMDSGSHSKSNSTIDSLVKTSGFSFNIDRNIGKHLKWRTEFRTFSSKDEIFTKDNSVTKNNNAITTSLALTF